MTLPSATLFPQALLPLYIFEPRYRKMLADALQSNRMFCVAMQKQGRLRETPSTIAGLGLIRVSVDNPDGTSHLILQGLTRVQLVEAVQYKPYRVHKVEPLHPGKQDSVAIDALLQKVRDLVVERIQMGFNLPFPMPGGGEVGGKDKASVMSVKEVLKYLDDLQDPDQLADLVSCALIPGANERQVILETVEIEPRLKALIHFLIAEIKQNRKKKQ